MTQAEVDTILADPSKRIEGDIAWRQHDDQYSTTFRVDVISGPGFPLFVNARCNPKIGGVTFALIHRAEGRIYGLCVGKDHHNPTCENVGDPHVHRWQDVTRDKIATGVDLRALAGDPVALWKFFCDDARIGYAGTLARPPATQEELF